MIDGMAEALGVLLQWPNPVWVIIGVLFGMLIGLLPGMAGSVALALLIPVSFTMEPEVAVLFLIGAYSPAGFGGMLTSILVNTPGAPENAATTFDGYPMSKQGRAGAAIGAATAASVIGGLLGTVALLALIPPAKRFVLAFSYPEFFAMAVLGLTVIAVVTERNTYKGLSAAGLGFLLSFIGLDPITGSPRFTFGEIYLWDGLSIVPVLIGLFAGAEVLALFGKGISVAGQSGNGGGAMFSSSTSAAGEPVTFWQGVRSAFRRWFLVVRASVLGTVIGVVPGVGGSVSGFLAYSHAKQTSRHPEKFGRGAVDGVIAAESANDAKEGGSLLPTVAFGIPGTVGMAVLLGALIMHGIPVGPTLMIEHANLIYVLVIGMVASKFVAPLVVWLVARHAASLTTLRPGLFTPLIAVAALVGTYTIRQDIRDVVLAVVFGYIGYAMRRYGFSRITLLIALVLGELVERSYYQTLEAFGGPWVLFSRPISGLLVVLGAVVVVYALVQAWRRQASSGQEGASAEGGEEELPVLGRQPGRLLFDSLLLAFAVTIVVSAMSIQTDAATMPLLVGLPVAAALAVQLVVDAVPTLGARIRAAARTIVPVPRRPEVPTGQPLPSDGTRPSGSHVAVLAEKHSRTEATEEAERAADERADRIVLWRQVAFASWSAGFIGLAILAGFVVAIPVALLFFLRVLAREGWVTSIAVTAGAWLFLYGLFDLALGVSLS